MVSNLRKFKQKVVGGLPRKKTTAELERELKDLRKRERLISQKEELLSRRRKARQKLRRVKLAPAKRAYRRVRSVGKASRRSQKRLDSRIESSFIN